MYLDKMMSSMEKKTKGVTIRLPNGMIDELQGYAKQKQISFNTLTNQIFRSFIEWDSKAIDAGWLVFPKRALRELINTVSEKEVEVISKHCAEFSKDMRLMMGINDLEGFLALLKQKGLKSGFGFSETRENDGAIQFVMQHKMGQSWSTFNKILYSKIIDDLGYIVNIDTTENTIALNMHPK